MEEAELWLRARCAASLVRTHARALEIALPDGVVSSSDGVLVKDFVLAAAWNVYAIWPVHDLIAPPISVEAFLPRCIEQRDAT